MIVNFPVVYICGSQTNPKPDPAEPSQKKQVTKETAGVLVSHGKGFS